MFTSPLRVQKTRSKQAVFITTHFFTKWPRRVLHWLAEAVKAVGDNRTGSNMAEQIPEYINCRWLYLHLVHHMFTSPLREMKTRSKQAVLQLLIFSLRRVSICIDRKRILSASESILLGGNGTLRAIVAPFTPSECVRRLPRPEIVTNFTSPHSNRFRSFQQSRSPFLFSKSKTMNSANRSIPKLAKPTVYRSVSWKAILELNFHQPQQQPWPSNQKTTEQQNWSLIVHWNLLSKRETNSYKTWNEKRELLKRETRKGLLGADILTVQTNPFNTEVSSWNVFKSNHRRRLSPSDSSLIKLSCQI